MKWKRNKWGTCPCSHAKARPAQASAAHIRELQSQIMEWSSAPHLGAAPDKHWWGTLFGSCHFSRFSAVFKLLVQTCAEMLPHWGAWSEKERLVSLGLPLKCVSGYFLDANLNKSVSTAQFIFTLSSWVLPNGAALKGMGDPLWFWLIDLIDYSELESCMSSCRTPTQLLFKMEQGGRHLQHQKTNTYIPFQIACNLAITANMTNFRLMQPSDAYTHLPQLTVHYFNFWLCRCLTAARYNINKRTRCGSKGAKKQCHKTPTNSVHGCFLFYVFLNRLH